MRDVQLNKKLSFKRERKKYFADLFLRELTK